MGVREGYCYSQDRWRSKMRDEEGLAEPFCNGDRDRGGQILETSRQNVRQDLDLYLVCEEREGKRHLF